MNSSNTLLALAYIQISDNPYRVFCNYICYCMMKSGKESYLSGEIIKMVGIEFNLYLPHHLLKKCIELLKREEEVFVKPKGAGYALLHPKLNIERFEAERTSLKIEEEHLLKSIVEYVITLKQKWNEEDAKTYLGDALQKSFGVELFINGNLDKTDNIFDKEESPENKITPSWYIGQFIRKVTHERTVDYDYLIKINQGIMIYIGVNETTSSNQELSQKFKGTDFFFDTRLVLRALGYSCGFEVNAVNELKSLITKEYGGNIHVFSHTITEVVDALNTAALSLKKGDLIKDFELKYYSDINNCSYSDFEIFAQSAKKNIEENLLFEIDPPVSWNDDDVRKYNLDWGDLVTYIKNKFPKWNYRTVEFDVSSINCINTIRKEQYSYHFGGRSKLPIFVTSNTALIWAIKEYTKYQNSKTDITKHTPWDVTTIPLISDDMLMYRLWLPTASKYKDLPILALARNAFAAQQADTMFYNRLRDVQCRMAELHGSDIIDLGQQRNLKLEEIIVKNANGNIDNVTTEIVAVSIEELVKIENMANLEEIARIQADRDNKINDLIALNQKIIISAIDRISKMCPLYIRSLSYISKHVWLIYPIILAPIFILANSLLSKNQISLIFTIPTASIFVLIDKTLNRQKVQNNISHMILSWASKKYSVYVSQVLTTVELPHKHQILEGCLEKFYKSGKGKETDSSDGEQKQVA